MFVSYDGCSFEQTARTLRGAGYVVFSNPDEILLSFFGCEAANLLNLKAVKMMIGCYPKEWKKLPRQTIVDGHEDIAFNVLSLGRKRARETKLNLQN